ILVVDDSSAMQETLRLALSSEGYRVATAGCADEAFARMAEDEFDVVITDIVMPGVDGLQVLDRSRLLNPRAAVILMTGHPSVDTAVAALRRGACDYIEKPFRLDILSLRVRHLVQHREAIWREALRRRAPRPSAETLVGESLGI